MAQVKFIGINKSTNNVVTNYTFDDIDDTGDVVSQVLTQYSYFTLVHTDLQQFINSLLEVQEDTSTGWKFVMEDIIYYIIL